MKNMNQQTSSGFQWLVVRRRLCADMQASLERFETVKQCVENTTVSKINRTVFSFYAALAVEKSLIKSIMIED